VSDGRRVLCWRHGRTSWNAQKLFQGQTDIPLDDVGTAQAARAAALLSALKPDAIVTSDLSRAAQTAEALAEITGLTPVADAGLRERTAGEWEGLNREEIIARWPEQYSRFEVPGGEDMAEVGVRVVAAVQRGLADLPEDGLLVVVSHGGALRAGIIAMLGLPPEHREALGPLGNCSWSVLGRSPMNRWRLLEHNAASLPEDFVLSDDR
jgi:glucosyl-3-phosphoglycerate phosphatase